jgi:hypothetical protein
VTPLIGVYRRHHIYLAGVAVGARDAIELIWRLRSYGFDDTAERIESALTIRTLPTELRDSDRDAVLYALVDRRKGGGLATLRSALLDQGEGRDREGHN